MSTRFDLDYFNQFATGETSELPTHGILLEPKNGGHGGAPIEGLGSIKDLREAFQGKCEAMFQVGSSNYLLINPISDLSPDLARLSNIYKGESVDPNNFTGFQEINEKNFDEAIPTKSTLERVKRFVFGS